MLEIAAGQLLPALVAEVSTQALRHAVGGVVASTGKCSPTARRSQAARLLRAVATATVISQMPGRVRLQVVGLRGNAVLAAALRTRLQRLPGVRSVDSSVLTGKVLVQYDASQTALSEILAATERSEPPAQRRNPSRRAAAGPPSLALVVS